MPVAYRTVLVTYAVLGLGMWTVPLLSVLHVESAAVIATVGYFAAGLSTLVLLRSGTPFRRVVVLQEAALLIPWVLLTVSALWRPNCDYLRGLAFFAGFPGVTVLFAAALARLLHALPIRRKSAGLVGVGVLLLIAPPIYDLGFHPQFYTYNHVFGGFLGPIYDEELAVRPGLYAFRALTVLWSVLFVALAAVFDRKDAAWGVVSVCGGLIAAAYVFAPSLGLVTTVEQIERALGGVHRTAHFEIVYDPDHTTRADLRRLEDEHEFRYAAYRDLLGVRIDGRIRSYVYPSADVRAALTGAGSTNVAPVWLATPQTHVLASDFAAVFPHELAHVFSREFGLPVIRASLAVGLLEGFAVALEPPDGFPSPHEQVSAALLAGHLPSRSDGPVDDLVDVVASHLSPLGFWTGRGAVSYTTMGSFVRYLIDAYGAGPFVRAYPTGAFTAAYGKTPTELAREWTGYLLSLEAVGRSTADLVAARFAVPSLFEMDCPHYVEPHRRRLLDARRALAVGDSAAAYASVSAALAIEAGYLPALDLWAALALRYGDAPRVVERLSRPGTALEAPSIRVRLGDGRALSGDVDAARREYELALAGLPSFAHEAASRIGLRSMVAGDARALRRLLGVAPSDSVRSKADGPDRESGEDDSGDDDSVQRDASNDSPRYGALDHGDPEDDLGVRLAEALALGREGRYEQAIELLRTTPAEVPVQAGARARYARVRPEDELLRRRLVWLAEFSYGAGRVVDALAFADSAETAYRRVGAFGEAEAVHDFVEKMTWLSVEGASAVGRRPRTRYFDPPAILMSTLDLDV